MQKHIITLTTDFGWGSYYVGQMKGAIYLRDPDAQVIDLSHDMAPFDIPAAAYWVNRATRLFPPDTIHVVVVDPGVGTRRDLVYCRTKRRTFLAPDNGVLGAAVRLDGLDKLIRLSNAQLFHADVSQTFHGRDILAPVAAKLSLGASPSMLGDVLDQLSPSVFSEPVLEPHRIRGSIVYVDRFGNLITDIPRALVDQLASAHQGAPKVRVGGREIRRFAGTYGENPPQTLVALYDSDGFLEVAVAHGSAASLLGTAAGAAVEVEWGFSSGGG
jgi:S-adenosylmethionine hydrolase